MKPLLEKIFTLSDIDEIADLISNHLKKPIIIEDHQFSLLAYNSFYIDRFDEVNKLTIFAKRWPISIVEKFFDEGIVDQLKTSSKPFRVKEMKEIGLNQRVVVSAKYKGTIYGYIWIQETAPLLTDKEFAFIHEVSSHIAKLLYENNQNKLKKSQERDIFFKKVIGDFYQTEEQMKSAAANVNVKFPKFFILNVFSVPHENEHIFNELLDRIILYLNTLRYPTHLFTDHLKIIVLIGSDLAPSRELTESTKNLTFLILDHFPEQTIYSGISNEHSSVLKLKHSYLEALEVIKTGKFLGLGNLPSFEYKNLGILRYLETISSYHTKLNYTNSDLLILKQKDEESQTSLIETLEVFLLNNCRLKPSAEQLYIHTNTLKYRLNQIAALTSIQFDSFLMNCQLYIDIQLMKTDE